jgi:hypothetical protein
VEANCKSVKQCQAKKLPQVSRDQRRSGTAKLKDTITERSQVATFQHFNNSSTTVQQQFNTFTEHNAILIEALLQKAQGSKAWLPPGRMLHVGSTLAYFSV